MTGQKLSSSRRLFPTRMWKSQGVWRLPKFMETMSFDKMLYPSIPLGLVNQSNSRSLNSTPYQTQSLLLDLSASISTIPLDYFPLDYPSLIVCSQNYQIYCALRLVGWTLSFFGDRLSQRFKTNAQYCNNKSYIIILWSLYRLINRINCLFIMLSAELVIIQSANFDS